MLHHSRQWSRHTTPSQGKWTQRLPFFWSDREVTTYKWGRSHLLLGVPRSGIDRLKYHRMISLDGECINAKASACVANHGNTLHDHDTHRNATLPCPDSHFISLHSRASCIPLSSSLCISPLYPPILSFFVSRDSFAPHSLDLWQFSYFFTIHNFGRSRM